MGFSLILSHRTLVFTLVCLVAIISSFWVADSSSKWLPIWPSACALLIVLVTQRAFLGLLVGAYSGAILLANGRLLESFEQLVTVQFLQIFESEWKLSALLFTLLLGGFVALVEAGGGLQSLLKTLLRKGESTAKRMQLTVLGFGLFVFFDGLANTMLIGRLLRSAVHRCGVSRLKLAYLADSTGSAVACVALISTWIAFQLSMIGEGLAAVGQDGSPYALFLKSIATNFYCWFTLLLVFVGIIRDFNPGPMGPVERDARKHMKVETDDEPEAAETKAHWLTAVVPVIVLVVSVPLITYFVGASGSLFPFTLQNFSQVYADAEKYVPQILVLSSLAASMVAGFTLWRQQRGNHTVSRHVGSVFVSGIRDLFVPICILITAWMLGSAIAQLGAATLLSDLLHGAIPPQFVPVVIFGLGALISFSTGTSWGTMGVLMPIAIPVIFSLSDGMLDSEREQLVIAAIGAVFSGAVFGDHCSPFSDTTIVSSIASGVEPMDHVRTQFPFAFIAASVAAVFGFIPLGFGVPAWMCLLAGGTFIVILPTIWSVLSRVKRRLSTT